MKKDIFFILTIYSEIPPKEFLKAKKLARPITSVNLKLILMNGQNLQ